MNREEIEKILMSIISEVTSIPEEEMTPEIINKFWMDSFHGFEIINEIEDKFEIDLSEKEFLDDRSITIKEFLDWMLLRISKE